MSAPTGLRRGSTPEGVAGSAAAGDPGPTARPTAPVSSSVPSSSPWSGVPAGTRPARPAGRRDATRPAGRADAPVAASERLAVAGSSCAAHRLRAGEVPLRRTAPTPSRVLRRRRVLASAVLGLVLAGLVVLGVLLAPAPSSGGGAVPSGVSVTVVGDGESLTDVARRTAPGADTAATVERIRTLNALSGSALTPGRPLRVPATSG